MSQICENNILGTDLVKYKTKFINPVSKICQNSKKKRKNEKKKIKIKTYEWSVASCTLLFDIDIRLHHDWRFLKFHIDSFKKWSSCTTQDGPDNKT